MTKKKNVVNVCPQFIICGDCSCVAETMNVEVKDGKVETSCVNCGSTNIGSGY